MTETPDVIAESMRLMRKAGAARDSSRRAVAQSHVLMNAADSIRRASRRLRLTSLLARRRAKRAGTLPK